MAELDAAGHDVDEAGYHSFDCPGCVSPPPPTFTNEEKLEEVRREIAMRERVWSDRIARGDKSTLRKMALIRAIEADYVAACSAGRLL